MFKKTSAIFLLLFMFSSSSGALERRFSAEVIFWTLLNKASCASPTPKGVYLWTFKNNNLWTFMAHWWTFLTKKTPHHPISCASPTPKGVYLWTFKNNNSWTFMAHWWTFLTKKTKTFLSKQSFTRQPNPEGGYLWTFKIIIYEHLWLIDGHFWPKKQRHSWLKKQRHFRPKNEQLAIIKEYSLKCRSYFLHTT